MILVTSQLEKVINPSYVNRRTASLSYYTSLFLLFLSDNSLLPFFVSFHPSTLSNHTTIVPDPMRRVTSHKDRPSNSSPNLMLTMADLTNDNYDLIEPGMFFLYLYL